jgi:hypothetical protein
VRLLLLTREGEFTGLGAPDPGSISLTLWSAVIAACGFGLWLAGTTLA